MSYFHAIYGQGESPVPPTPSEDHPPVLLWENSAPTSTFTAQTVELDLSEYVGVIIEYNNRSNDSVMTSREYVKKGEELYGSGTSTSDYAYKRKATVTDTGVIFDASKSVSTANETAIPVKIYGVQSYIVEEETSAPELLWTNENPTTNFASQIISLDLTGYVGVIVESKHLTTSDDIGSRVYCKHGETKALGVASATAYNGGQARVLSVSTSGVEFKDNYESNTLYNQGNIPTKIYGVKGVVVEPVIDISNYSLVTGTDITVEEGSLYNLTIYGGNINSGADILSVSDTFQSCLIYVVRATSNTIKLQGGTSTKTMMCKIGQV